MNLSTWGTTLRKVSQGGGFHHAFFGGDERRAQRSREPKNADFLLSAYPPAKRGRYEAGGQHKTKGKL